MAIKLNIYIYTDNHHAHQLGKSLIPVHTKWTKPNLMTYLEVLFFFLIAFPDGRVVPVSAGQFTVDSASVSVIVSRVTTADITPPSRITDLTVTSVHDTTVNLTWAAPGGDLDQGSGESSVRK